MRWEIKINTNDRVASPESVPIWFPVYFIEFEGSNCPIRLCSLVDAFSSLNLASFKLTAS